MTNGGAWDGILSQDEVEVFEVEVYDRLGYWRHSQRRVASALVLIDLANNFTGDRPEPLSRGR